MVRKAERGRVYRCSDSPSGYIYVDAVLPEFKRAIGWGDQTGYTRSHLMVVPWKALRNTRRKGPFGAGKARTLDA